MDNKYYELDKEMSKEVMAQLAGKVVDHICPDCNGEGEHQLTVPIKCENCNGTGIITIQY